MSIPPITDTIPELAHGWTAERKTRFLDHLSVKGNVRAACKRVSMSREAAYRQRRRDPLFARGWAAAMVQARENGAEVLADRAIDGVEEEIYYRGELVGTRRRYDSRLLLAHVARLDKVADERAAVEDAARFDELLALIAGEQVPEDLRGDDLFPLDRESVAERAAKEAELTVRYGGPEDAGDGEDDCEDRDGFDAAAFDALEDACAAAYLRGRAEGEERWDAWFDNACGFVDSVSGWPDGPPAPGLPGGSPLAASAGRETGETGAARFDPRTVSDVSTTALARALAGPVHGFKPAPRLHSPRRATMNGR